MGADLVLGLIKIFEERDGLKQSFHPLREMKFKNFVWTFKGVF